MTIELALEGVLIGSDCLGASLMNARMHIDTANEYLSWTEKEASGNSNDIRIAFDGISIQIDKLQEIYDKSIKLSEQNMNFDVGYLLNRLIKTRKLREKYFSSSLFSDPAWDILLDLSIAKIKGQQIPVLSLCVAASVPTSTALRKIKEMLADGLISKEPDRKDKRRTYISISDHAYDSMVAYISESARLASAELLDAKNHGTGKLSNKPYPTSKTQSA